MGRWATELPGYWLGRGRRGRPRGAGMGRQRRWLRRSGCGRGGARVCPTGLGERWSWLRRTEGWKRTLEEVGSGSDLAFCEQEIDGGNAFFSRLFRKGVFPPAIAAHPGRGRRRVRRAGGPVFLGGRSVTFLRRNGVLRDAGRLSRSSPGWGR